MQLNFKDVVQEISDKVFEELLGQPSIQLHEWPERWEKQVVSGLIYHYGRPEFTASLAIQNDKESAVLIGTVEDELVGDDVTVRMVLSMGNSGLTQIIPDNMIPQGGLGEIIIGGGEDTLDLERSRIYGRIATVGTAALVEAYLEVELLLPSPAALVVIERQIKSAITDQLNDLSCEVTVSYYPPQQAVNVHLIEENSAVNVHLTAKRK